MRLYNFGKEGRYCLLLGGGRVPRDRGRKAIAQYLH